MIFRVPVLADGLASLSFEVDRRRVEKYDVQIAEQIAPPREQLLLDQVLVAIETQQDSGRTTTPWKASASVEDGFSVLPLP
jgi:hypothetical protein